MTFPMLAKEAPRKGVHLVGSGDCLHHTWLSELKELNHVAEGTFELENTRFIPTVEVQGRGRTHHLIMFPSISAVEQFRDSIKNKSKNLATDGRPNVQMTGEEIVELACEVDALVGPCHAFTPWTGMYGYFDSLRDCYGQMATKIAFLELGLSADSDYADRLSELENVTLLSNSDAHSPYPLRLGREFNQFEVKELTFSEIKKAILRQGGRKCTLNVGLPPGEGKYNQSGCIKCYTLYSLTDSIKNNWKCICGGRIKKGVSDRVSELANYSGPKHPPHRPKYLHLIPLSEIISKALGITCVGSVSVRKMWEALIFRFENEIEILLEADFDEIESITNKNIATAIKCFRENKIIIHPGGGGRYGQLELPYLD